MVESPGWDKVVKPYLLDKLNQSFPDPSKFTKDEEFMYAAKTASVFKKVIAELLVWVETHRDKVTAYDKKLKGEVDPFQIGRWYNMSILVKQQSGNNGGGRNEGPEWVEVPFENRVTTKDGVSFHWAVNERRSFQDDGVGKAHAAITGDPVVEDKIPFGDSRS